MENVESQQITSADVGTIVVGDAEASKPQGREVVKMTPAELSAHVRSVQRRCRGPRIASVADALDAYVAYRKATGADAMDPVHVEELGKMDSVQAIISDMLECGAEDDAKFVDGLREPCGADFNEVILAGPLDGREHPYKCQVCGIEGVYRPPRITLVEAAD